MVAAKSEQRQLLLSCLLGDYKRKEERAAASLLIGRLSQGPRSVSTGCRSWAQETNNSFVFERLLLGPYSQRYPGYTEEKISP